MRPKSFESAGFEKKQQGLTMIELLITLLVTSIGLLGIAMLQVKASSYSQATFDRSRAIVQASDLVDRFWAGACALETDLSGTVSAIETAWLNDHSLASPAGWSKEFVTVTATGSIFEIEVVVPIVNKNEDNVNVAEVTQTSSIPLPGSCPP